MNAILKIIEGRKLYTHLILFRLYIDTQGRTNESFRGNWMKELEVLFVGDFNKEMTRTAHQYLYSEGFTKYSNSQTLTPSGRGYIENWAREFSTIDESDKQILEQKLPTKVFEYLGIIADSYSVGTLVSQLVNQF